MPTILDIKNGFWPINSWNGFQLFFPLLCLLILTITILCILKYNLKAAQSQDNKSQISRGTPVAVPMCVLQYDKQTEFYHFSTHISFKSGQTIEKKSIIHNFDSKDKVVVGLISDKKSNIYLKHPGNLKICLIQINTDRFLLDFCMRVIKVGVNLFQKDSSSKSRRKKGFFKNAQLEDFRDENGLDLMMHAVREKNHDIVIRLLKLGFRPINSNNDGKKAIDIAWEYYVIHQDAVTLNIIMSLLQYDSMYPKEIEYDPSKAPKEIWKFSQKSERMRKFVRRGSTENLKKEFKRHNLKIFYDITNKSLINFALNMLNYEMYDELLEQGFKEGHQEDNALLNQKLKDKRNDVRNDNFNKAQNVCPGHIADLMGKSKKIGSYPYHDEKLKEMFLFLDSKKNWSLILQVAAGSENLKILFDFTQLSTRQADPDSGEQTTGIMYENGRVIIAAKNLIHPLEKIPQIGRKLYEIFMKFIKIIRIIPFIGSYLYNILDDHNKYKVYGTFLHELFHHAILKSFMNNFNPYQIGESSQKSRFRKVFNNIKSKCKCCPNIDSIFALVFQYKKHEQFSELAVRPAQMDVIYHYQQIVTTQHQQMLKEIYEYTEEVTILEINEFLNVRKQLKRESDPIFYKDLTQPLKLGIKNSEVKFQGAQTTFSDIFGEFDVESEEVMNKLTANDIREILLRNEVMNVFSSLQFGTYENLIPRILVNRKTAEQTKSTEICSYLETNKIFILSEYAGFGKTVWLNNVGFQLKTLEQSRLIILISFSDHREALSKYNGTNLIEIMLEIVKGKSEFEIDIFKFLFLNGLVVLIFDEFDRICPKFKDLAIQFLQNIQDETKNWILISTRPHHVDLLEVKLSTAAHCFSNFTSENNESLLHSLNVTKDCQHLQSVIKTIESERFNQKHIINNPTIRIKLALMYSNDDSDFMPNTYNLFNIMDKLIVELKLSFFTKVPVDDVLVNIDCNIYHYVALIRIFGDELKAIIDNLANTHIYNDIKQLADNGARHNGIEWFYEKIQRVGLLSLDDNSLKSIHICIDEYYVVDFLKSRLYENKRVTHDNEYENALSILRHILKLTKKFHLICKMLYGLAKEVKRTSNAVISNTIKRQIINNLTIIQKDIHDSECPKDSFALWSAILSAEPEICDNLCAENKFDQL